MGRVTRQDTYSGQLFHHCHGCALLNPEPNTIGTKSQHQWHGVYADGVRVGDVGLISDSGDFISLFNIFKPSDDPVNRIYGVPPGFKPLEFHENLFMSSSKPYHISNARIASKHTREIKLNADGTVWAPGMPVAPGIGIELRFSRAQGAVLRLPEGAHRVDYHGLPDIRTYTTENAESWYRYLNDQVRMDAHNGSLYVVTGYDRTKSYENLTFNSSFKDTSLSFRFSCPLLPNGEFGSLALSYSSVPEHEHWRGASSPGHTLNNLSPFIRGFKVMIRQRFRYKTPIKIMDLTKADPKSLLYKGPVPNLTNADSASPPNSSSSNSSVFRSPVPSPSTTSSGSSNSTRSSRNSGEGSRSSSTGAQLDSLSPITSYSLLSGDNESVSDSLSPRGSSIFDSDSESDLGVPVFELHHPSDIINEYILDKCPDAFVAVTHDEEWSAILEETDDQFPNKSILISRMLKKFPLKFKQANSQDSLLGAHLSPILRRIEPGLESTPSKGKPPETCTSDENRHVNESNNDQATSVNHVSLGVKHARAALDDYYSSSKRRKLGPEKFFAIHDTQPDETRDILVKTEEFDEDLDFTYGDIHAASADADHKSLYPYGAQPTTAQLSPFSITWDTNSVGTATPSLISCSSATNSPNSMQQLTTFSSEDYGAQLSPFSTTWGANSVGTATPSLVSCSSATNSPQGPAELTTSSWGNFVELGYSGYTVYGLKSTISAPQSWYNPPMLTLKNASNLTFSPYPDSDITPSGSSPSGIRTGESSIIASFKQDGVMKPVVASHAVVAAASMRRRRRSTKALFTCHLCAATFTAKHNLTNHLNSHLGIRKYKCNACGQSYGTKYVLKRHIHRCKGDGQALRICEGEAKTTGDDKMKPVPAMDFAFNSRRSQTPTAT